MGEDKTRDPESREVIPTWSSNRTNIFPSFSSHCLASFRVYGFMAPASASVIMWLAFRFPEDRTSCGRTRLWAVFQRAEPGAPNLAGSP
jgi:hypothetical protein